MSARSGARRASFEEALAGLLASVSAKGAEVVAINECAGRVLASDIVAAIDVPAYARSAVDGFAVRSSDLGAEAVALRVVAQVRPADEPPTALRNGECVHVATGASVPSDADAVVMIEDVVRAGGLAQFSKPIASGKHVISPGEDIARGETLLRAGRVLRPADLGAAASLDISVLSVVARPTVSVIVSGNEIVPAGAERQGRQIVDSNSIVVRALAIRDGASLEPVRYVPDDEAALCEALQRASADVVIVSGGSSVGDEDHAPRALERLGGMLVRGVAVRPGGPTCLGRLGQRAIVLLPGHPLACLAAYEMFAGPMIRKLGGRPTEWPHRTVEAPLGVRIESVRGRTDYVRVMVEGGVVRPLTRHTGASNLSSAVRADGAVLVPAEAERVEAGEKVRVFLF